MTDFPPVRLFSTDLDGTLLGNPESTRRFRLAWDNLAAGHRPLLIYNSGRLVPDLERVVMAEHLPRADFFIGGVGTQIFDVKAGSMIREFDQELTQGW
ncbi:MAG TPA: HAD family hydrolase, partial [Opitutaceae bacterium]|nr:HAD family hydrolase [Opitutaceae bacterium]